MDGLCIAFADFYLLGDGIHMALVVLAHWADKYDPVALPVADAVVFLLLLLWCCTSHSSREMLVKNSLGENRPQLLLAEARHCK